jgi:hypothetical protein
MFVMTSPGQRIWGWSIKGRRKNSTAWLALTTGESIGHRRLLTCDDLIHSAAAGVPDEKQRKQPQQQHEHHEHHDQQIQQKLKEHHHHHQQQQHAPSDQDPPDPAPSATDVYFTDCAAADAWVTGVNGSKIVHHDAKTGTEWCLTLDGAPSEFQFISVAKCAAKGTDADKQQHWTFPFTPTEHYVAFAGTAASAGGGAGTAGGGVGDGGSGDAAFDTPVIAGANAPAATPSVTAGTSMCVQINGDHPWTGNRAVVWDCQAASADEVVVALPASLGVGGFKNLLLHPRADASGGHKLMIDMSSYGGGKLCMTTRTNQPVPPPPIQGCAELEALQFEITETPPAAASAPPPQIRAFAVY